MAGSFWEGKKILAGQLSLFFFSEQISSGLCVQGSTSSYYHRRTKAYSLASPYSTSKVVLNICMQYLWATTGRHPNWTECHIHAPSKDPTSSSVQLLRPVPTPHAMSCIPCHTLKYLILGCECLLENVYPSLGFFENFSDFFGNYSYFS